MDKLCVIYKSAPHYREPIFLLMDREMDVDWHFGSFCDSTGMIEQLDTTKLQRVWKYDTRMIGQWYWMKGYLSLLFKKEYQSYLMLGETRDLSLCVFLTLKKLLYPRKRAYLWTHGFYGKESKTQRILKKWMFGMADGNFTYNQHAKDIMVELGFDPNKIWPIHNSLNHDAQVVLRNQQNLSDVYRNHFGNSHHNLIFVGRLTRVKRLDLLLETLSKLEDCNLTLIGDGPEKEILQQQAEQLGITDRVWFFGACYDETTNAELIYNADLCVAPGNVGLTAIHTMVFGCPVATHDSFQWQMPEFEAVKEGKTGTFFHYHDVESMSHSIAFWLNHNDREAVRQSCYDEIDRYWTPEYQVGVLKSHIR